MPASAPYTSKEVLDLQSLSVNSGAVPAYDGEAVQVVGFLGDVVPDMSYGANDSLDIARFPANLDSGFKGYPLADPLIIGDITGDGKLNSSDSQRVAQAAVSATPPPQIPSLPSVGVRGGITIGTDPTITIPTDFTAKPQATLVVPVNLDYSDGLDAVDLALSYDASRLDVTALADIQPGSLLSEPGQDAAGNAWTFGNFLVSLDRASGTILISAYREGGGLSGFGSGSLLTIGFHVKDNAPAGAAAVTLQQAIGDKSSLLGGTDNQGNDFLFDVEPRPGFGVTGTITVQSPTLAPAAPGAAGAAQQPLGDGDFLFDLEPQPNNAAGDLLDGRINVTPVKLSDPSPAVPADRMVVSPIIPGTLAQSAEPVGDAPQHLIVSASVGGAYPPAADTANLAALLHLLVSSAMASYYTTAGPDVSANAVPRTGDGVLTILAADNDRTTAPAALAADIFFSQYPGIGEHGIVGSDQGRFRVFAFSRVSTRPYSGFAVGNSA